MNPAVEAWHRALGRIIDESRLAGGDELVGIVAAALAPMGISVELYLVDVAQQTLHAVPPGMGHLDPQPPAVGHETLAPGDRVLLYTDGVTEARCPSGDLFGLAQLVDVTELHHTDGLSAPDALRRIARAVLGHQHGELQDDATLLLVEWTAERPKGLSP